MFWNRRAVRIGVGLALLVLALVVILPNITGYTSLDGTVNARFVIVSAPIEGMVQNTAPRAGTPISKDEHLLAIRNDRIDRSTVVELSAELKATRERLESLASQEHRLEALRNDLTKRLSSYQNAVIINLDQQIAIQKERIGINEARREERKSELTRKEQLRVTGNVPASELERIQLSEHIAQHEIDAAKSELSRIEAEREAAQRGIFIGEARNDVPYSLQRADELAILLADVTTRRKEQEGRVTKLLDQMIEANARIRQMGSADISADFDAVIWRNNVVTGSNVIVGQELLRILDCRDLFVDILVHEVSYDDIFPGLEAEIRLYGSNKIFPGTVQSVRGSRSDTEDKVLAADPPRGEGKYARIRVNISPSEINTDYKNYCQVGRTVHVRFPRRSVPLKNWLRTLWFSIS